MHTAPLSHRIRGGFFPVRMRLVVASFALAAFVALVTISSRASAGDAIQMVHFSEENLPAQDMPSTAATPEAGPTADWQQVGPPSSGNPAAGNPAAVNSPAPGPSVPAAPVAGASPEAAPAAATSPSAPDANAAQLEPTPMPTPGDIAPLEVGSVAPQMQISDNPLDSLIQRVHTAQPALAASLRMTDQAREQILNHHEDDAIQTLTGAMSIDGGDPYAYFYLGRAYLGKKKYDQAVTFLSRAENRLGDNPQWLGETLAFEGLANEQAGQTPQAIGCYQRALVAVPGNLMARVALSRLGGSEQAGVQPVSAPGAPEAAPGEAPEAASDEDAPEAAPDSGAAQPPPASQPPPPAAN
jgi:hypothetical protein